jgi:mRNA-degrading endonuclease RelE of RelBE toxin-antitoxin system
MAVYNIQWKHSAVKELRKIESKNRSKILQAVGQLSHVPFRIGDYRVVYEVESANLVVVIVRVRHRKSDLVRRRRHALQCYSPAQRAFAVLFQWRKN